MNNFIQKAIEMIYNMSRKIKNSYIGIVIKKRGSRYNSSSQILTAQEWASAFDPQDLR